MSVSTNSSNRIIVSYTDNENEVSDIAKCITSMFPLGIYDSTSVNHNLIIPKGNWVCIQVLGQASRDNMKIYRYQLG